MASVPMTHDAAHGDLTKGHRRVIFASSLGTVFEWYDFYLYGSLAAIISKQFFAGVNPTTGFIFALLAFAAAAVGVGDEDLVLEGARRDERARHGLEGRRERGRHGHQVCAGERQQPHWFRELEIVADQDPDPDAIQLDHGRRSIARAEGAAI